MVNGISKTLKIVKSYICGYCVNDLSTVFKNTPSSKRHFPAVSILMEHAAHGLILYDVGYSRRVYENGLSSKVYNALNPLYCAEEDELVYQLKQDGIDPKEIRHVVLSHLHPDHIGGLKDFPDAWLMISKGCFENLQNRKRKDLIFNNLLPDDVIERALVISEKQKSSISPVTHYFKETYDLFGDGSLYGVDLPGHAKGQLGLFLPEEAVLLVADACWGVDLLGKKIKWIPHLVQNNFSEYMATLTALTTFISKEPGVRVACTHDPVPGV